MPLRARLVVEPAVDQVVVGLAAVGDPPLGAVDGVSSPSASLARVVMSVAAEPASGSEIADGHRDLAADDARAGSAPAAPRCRGGRSPGPGRCWPRTPGTRRAGIPWPSSSMTISASTAVAAWPPYSSGRTMPRKPSSASRLTSSSGSGVRRRSQSAACGAYTSRATWAASSRSYTCSGVSSKPLKGSPVRESVMGA